MAKWRIVLYEICAKQDILNPAFEIISDVTKATVVHDGKLMKGDCLVDSYSVQAKNISTIIVPLADTAHDEISELKDEIAELKKQLKDKDAILMEQLKVIQQLASSLKQVIFDMIPKIIGVV